MFRRRLLLERAAWRLARGVSVTEASLEAGYDAVEAFSRAFARAHGVPRVGSPMSHATFGFRSPTITGVRRCEAASVPLGDFTLPSLSAFEVTTLRGITSSSRWQVR